MAVLGLNLQARQFAIFILHNDGGGDELSADSLCKSKGQAHARAQHSPSPAQHIHALHGCLVYGRKGVRDVCGQADNASRKRVEGHVDDVWVVGTLLGCRAEGDEGAKQRGDEEGGEGPVVEGQPEGGRLERSQRRVRDSNNGRWGQRHLKFSLIIE